MEAQGKGTMRTRIVLAVGMALFAFGCGGGEDGPGLSPGERCVVAEDEVKSCVEDFCAKGTAPAFCQCYQQNNPKGRDLDVDGCGCTFASFWETRKEAICGESLSLDGSVSCKSLQLEVYEGKCGPV